MCFVEINNEKQNYLFAIDIWLSFTETLLIRMCNVYIKKEYFPLH